MSATSKMNIDALIKDLILEDKFKAKYTARQRTIFCKNMYRKISNFLKEHEEELEDTREQVQSLNHQLQEANTRLEKYRNGYETSRRNRVTYQQLMMSVIETGVLIYFYYSVYHWITNSMQKDQSPRQSSIV